MTLRQVEARTSGRLTNAHLSQIENGRVRRVRMEYLVDLAGIYELDLMTLARHAGYPIPASSRGPGPGGTGPSDAAPVRSVPRAIFDGLTDEEFDQVLCYVGFLKAWRHERTVHTTVHE